MARESARCQPGTREASTPFETDPRSSPNSSCNALLTKICILACRYSGSTTSARGGRGGSRRGRASSERGRARKVEGGHRVGNGGGESTGRRGKGAGQQTRHGSIRQL